MVKKGNCAGANEAPRIIKGQIVGRETVAALG